jgi:hypothetical protein
MFCVGMSSDFSIIAIGLWTKFALDSLRCRLIRPQSVSVTQMNLNEIEIFSQQMQVQWGICTPKPTPLSTRYYWIFKLFIHKRNVKRIFKIKWRFAPPKTNFWLQHWTSKFCLCFSLLLRVANDGLPVKHSWLESNIRTRYTAANPRISGPSGCHWHARIN